MKMLKNHGLASLIVAMCVVCLLTVPAMAGQGDKGAGDTASQSKITQVELKNAALAYTKITDINQSFQNSVQQTEDHEERLRLQKAANQEMVQAVEKSGIDVETYNSIMAKIRTDQQLNEKFMEKVESMH